MLQSYRGHNSWWQVVGVQEHFVFQHITKESPRITRSRAVSFPIPVLAPVMRTVFPCRSAEDWHTPPAAYFLSKTQQPLGEQQLGKTLTWDLFGLEDCDRSSALFRGGRLDHMDSLGLIIHRENLEHEQFSLSHTSHTTEQSLRTANGSAGVMRTYIAPPTRSLLIGPSGCDESSRFITVLKLPQLHHSVPLISLVR